MQAVIAAKISEKLSIKLNDWARRPAAHGLSRSKGRIVKELTVRVCTLTALAAPLALFAPPSLAAMEPQGPYTFTSLIDPGGTPGGTFCFTFRQTGQDKGYANSGTVGSTKDRIHGNFQVVGKELRMEFASGGANTAVHMIATFGQEISGEFNTFRADRPAQMLVIGTVTLVKGCSKAALQRSGSRSAFMQGD